MRNKWLTLARRDPTVLSLNTSIYFCEDHFDLPNDMDNYMEYHVMGSVSQVRMKPSCISTKFECQIDRRKRTANTTERPYIVKKQRQTLIEEFEKDLEERSITIKHLELGEASSSSSVLHGNVEENVIPNEIHIRLQRDDKKQEASKILECTLLKIMKSPRFYTGVPKSCYYLIDLIEKQINIPATNILLCLKKIRLNNPFRELADDFSMSPSHASKTFLKNIPVLASVMRPFLVELNKDSIKGNLPMAFRHKYHNVSCIIDCLEIEVQKPSKALNQSLTWSEYKKANTVKYLVSCTPNGLVNYISPGFGGRITDTCLVESCDFINSLQSGMCVMADRGFKHVEQYLRRHGVQLVRPPSVTTGTKLSKAEARETKQIASLRIHIEQVIRRLREFNMLKPHACLNHNLVKVLDDVITVACGLINLQDSLIK